ncbi:MAG: transglutaminase-like domain-containing protein [Thermoplasmata archaeon]|jgi:hypothetical protein
MDFLSVPLPKRVEEEKIRGNFSSAMRIIDQYLSLDIPEDLRKRLEYEKFRLPLMAKDYGIGRRKAIRMLKDKIDGIDEEEFNSYINSGLVDYIKLEGRERYFNRFVNNLIFLKPELGERLKEKEDTRIKSLVNESIRRITDGERHTYGVISGIRIRMEREGFYRVWLPFPVENGFSKKVRLIRASHGNYFISDNMDHRTIYMEGKGKEFFAEFYYEISEMGIDDTYPKGDKHISEKLPHVRFSPYLRNIAESIVKDEGDPVMKARRIYAWVVSHVRYNYVPEYIHFDNIGEYMASSLRGDCGMQALLFITLSRISGVYAKWQSGWFVTPFSITPHDWAQVYADNGWIPVDPSFGNEFKGNPWRSDFYFGSLDAFRMVANEDFQAPFIPDKRYFRSDPVDNQRGEVEDENGNIYFDKRKLKLYVKKFERIE